MTLVRNRNPAKDQLAICGLGRSTYARDRGAVNELTLVLEASVQAVRDAGLTAADIDGVVGGGLATGGVDTSVVVEALGLPGVTWWAPARPPIGNHLSAALHAVWSGAATYVLVYHSTYRLGGAPLRARAALGLPDGRAQRGDGHTELEPWGMFGPTGYAAWAMRYLHDYSGTREDFGLVALNGRANAARNPDAVMRGPLSMADYLAARMVREPLCVYDMDVPVDGADAFVVTTAERAGDLAAPPVLVHASAMGMTARPQEHLAADLTDTGQAAAAAALRGRSDLWIEDADVYFPYDGFSVLTLLCLEAYGFCEAGEGGALLRASRTEGSDRLLLSGRVPLNPHGGSLSEGGSQGAGHLREAVRQLRGDAGARQVAAASCALLTLGGLFFNAQGLILRTA